MVMIKGLFM